MREIRDPETIQQWIETSRIQENFDTPDLPFRLYEYESGEMLVSPFKEFRELLFVVKGRVDIYGIKDNGNIIPINARKDWMILGDMEFCRKSRAQYHAEAKDQVVCLALPLESCRSELERDVRFLHTLLDSVSEKMELSSLLESSADTIEERVLFYMRNMCPNGELRGVDETTLKLRCSRRQLQRVLRKLCEEGKVEKIGKGCYRLAEGGQERKNCAKKGK